jgi:hypothetical protein
VPLRTVTADIDSGRLVVQLEDVPLGGLISGHLCIVAKNDPTM